MKKNLLIISSIAIVGFSSSAFVVMQSNGMAGFTGFAGESNCNSCHSGSAATTVNISATPAFASNQYVPGQTYTINIQVGSPTLTHFGFGAEVLNGTTSGATNAGTITAIAGSSQTKLSGSRTNAVHNSATMGTGSPSSHTFMFRWVAPQSGNANIFTSAMAVNNNGGNSGDAVVATMSLGLTPSSSTGILSLNDVATTISVFPNPSNENLTLQYHLISEGFVNATLYNLQGQKISVLFNDNQNVGFQSKTIIYPQGLEAGVYIVKLSQNGKELAERMLIKQ